MQQDLTHSAQIQPATPLLVGSVSDFDSFQLWHRSNYGNSYKTPSFEDVIKEMTEGLSPYYYDGRADCFFYFLGEYAKAPQYPGQRIDFTWRQVAARYEGAYSDFARYGCD